MKKISTLVLASLLTMAVFAADRRPSVTIQATRNYEIVVDGKTYSSMNGSMINLGNLRAGHHTINVYKVSQGFSFRKVKKVIASSTFLLRNNDLRISIDQSGSIRVTESKFGKDRDDGGWKDNDYDRNDGRDRDDRDRNDRRF